MKVEDLMIGDWVYITEPDDFHGYIGKVVITNAETNYIAVRIPNMHLHDVFVEDLQPIPLTKEILDKNGFKEHRYYGYFIGQSNSGYYIYFDNNYLSIHQSGYDIIEFAWCEYVHELQHALKLCEIKKEIVL